MEVEVELVVFIVLELLEFVEMMIVELEPFAEKPAPFPETPMVKKVLVVVKRP